MDSSSSKKSQFANITKKNKNIFDFIKLIDSWFMQKDMKKKNIGEKNPDTVFVPQGLSNKLVN